MSLTAAELAICNQALSLLGQTEVDSTDTSTADTGTGGISYKRCDLIYAQTRNVLLRSFEWNFANGRLALVADWATATAYTTDQYVWEDDVLYKCSTAHTSVAWNTDYLMDDTDYVMDGTDYVRDDSIIFYWDMVTDRPETYWAYRYALPADFNRFKIRWLKHHETKFGIEGKNVVTDETELNINYVKKVTDTTLFDDFFTEILIFDLAIKVSFPVMGSDYKSQALRKQLQDQRKQTMSKARQICVAEVEQSGDYTWTEARFGSGQV